MNTNHDISSIQFIFAKPHSEGYYLYGTNSVEELRLIPKNQLKSLLVQTLKCPDIEKLDYLLDRAFPFIYDTITGQIKQFQYVNDVPTKEDVAQTLRNDLESQLRASMYTPSIQNKYNILFKEGLLLH